MAGSLPILRRIYVTLGGRKTLREDVASEVDLVRVVTGRIPLAALEHVRRAGFSDREIERLVIPARTRRHRAERREPLTIDESDRLVRLARIQALAEDVFGEKDKANRWLRQPLRVLGGHAPLALAETDAGGRVVERVLAKIDWGAAA